MSLAGVLRQEITGRRHVVRFQWDLVCNREYLKDLSQTILTVGVMFGAMGFTTLSDYFGRKPVFLFSQWAMVVVGVVTAFVPNYYVFLVLRFCTGALQQVQTIYNKKGFNGPTFTIAQTLCSGVLLVKRRGFHVSWPVFLLCS